MGLSSEERQTLEERLENTCDSIDDALGEFVKSNVTIKCVRDEPPSGKLLHVYVDGVLLDSNGMYNLHRSGDSSYYVVEVSEKNLSEE